MHPLRPAQHTRPRSHLPPGLGLDLRELLGADVTARHRKDGLPDRVSSAIVNRVARALPRPAHRKPGSATGPSVNIVIHTPPVPPGGAFPGLSPEAWIRIRRRREGRWL